MLTDVKPLLRIYRGLVRDVEEILGMEPLSLECDLDRISRSARKRGLPFLVVDLPSLDQALSQGLESGRIESDGLVYGGKWLPNLFRQIFLLIFAEDGTLRQEADPLAIKCLRQLLKVFKKLRVPCPQEHINQKIDEFIEIEDTLLEPQLSWGDRDLVIQGSFPCLPDMVRNSWKLRFGTSYDELMGFKSAFRDELMKDLSFVQSTFDTLLKSFRFKEGWFQPRHGPGAVSEPYVNSKFEFPTWPVRLEKFFPYSDWGMVNHSTYDLNSEGIHDTLDPPAKLIDVPKDYKGPRLIASEPISSQYIQQGLMKVLRKNVRQSPLRFSVDFLSQEPSKELALSSSASRGMSTIDLSSASDRLSCALVECAFRTNYRFLEILNSARTPTVRLPDGSVLVQRKFAAQGAAFTFPVQSVIYACICIGVLRSDNPKARITDLARKVRVFGDDMIVPRHLFSRICWVLEACGLKVNFSKSFSKGYFRESCGTDAYKGVDVTSTSILNIYDHRDPGTLVSVVEQSNNLYLDGYINASRLLQETILWKVRKKIPWKRPGNESVFGFIGNGSNRLKARWNSDLHRTELLCLTVDNKVKKSSVDGHLRLIQWFIEKPLPESVWVPGYPQSVKPRYRLRWVRP
uniref:RNA-directed RNA polymerase n=1 Tax=Beihai levi-like virus 6 TaxID=1922424 RepID=A0A1L3KI75_9VIRU|nr:hypothetical protein [Beihai levi-like virus 6]